MREGNIKFNLCELERLGRVSRRHNIKNRTVQRMNVNFKE